MRRRWELLITGVVQVIVGFVNDGIMNIGLGAVLIILGLSLERSKIARIG